MPIRRPKIVPACQEIIIDDDASIGGMFDLARAIQAIVDHIEEAISNILGNHANEEILGRCHVCLVFWQCRYPFAEFLTSQRPYRVNPEFPSHRVEIGGVNVVGIRQFIVALFDD